MAGFAAGEQRWIEGLGNLRNTIRQHVIGVQLGRHVWDGATVLDVGCGQGTQALRLAARGCRVTGVDPSADLLGRFEASADAAGVGVELLRGSLGDVGALLGDRTFDVVTAHGLLMYLDDRAGAIAALAGRLRSAESRLSITFRNGHALAMRPGLRGDWDAAIAAFATSAYVNEVGVSARADRLEDVTADLAAVGLEVLQWSGVRVFNDAVGRDVVPPAGEELARLLEAEALAGDHDPYRWIASQLHVIAARA